jgi:hypothetical protein
MVTIQQYQVAVRANRRWDYCILAATVYMFAVMIIGGMLLGSFGEAWTPACAQWVVRHDLSHREFGLLTIAACLPVGFFVAMPAIMLLRLGDRRKRRDRRLVCPHCAAFLNHLAMLTGNCCRCGGQVIDVSSADAATAVCDHSLLTVAEFNTAVQKRQTLRDPKGADPRIRCPRCHMELTQRRFIVVATQKCPFCSAIILEDPESSAHENETLAQTQCLSLERFRRLNSAYIRWSLLSAVVLIPCGAVVVYLPLVGIEGTLTTLVGNVGFGIVAFTMCIAAICLGAWIGSLADRRIRKIGHLNCPYCHKSLVHASGIVVATRHCHHCGRRALIHDAISGANAVIG